MALRPSADHGLLSLEISRTHTTTPHNRQNSSGWVISSSQKLLPDNTQHSQQTSMPSAGFEPHKPSRQAAADLRLRPRGHWDRHDRTMRNLKGVSRCHFYLNSFSTRRIFNEGEENKLHPCTQGSTWRNLQTPVCVCINEHKITDIQVWVDFLVQILYRPTLQFFHPCSSVKRLS